MPYSHFNNSKVDLRSRVAMTNYLGLHWRYGTDYAWNVKIRNLDIPRNLVPSAFAMTDELNPYRAIGHLFEAFRQQHGDGSPANRFGGVGNVYVTTDGRSNGYIVLYGAESDQDYAEYEISELRRVVRLVQAFDALCDAAVALFMQYAEEHLAERRQDAYRAGAHDAANDLRFDHGLNDLPEYHAGYELSQDEAQAYLDDLDDSAAFDAGRDDALSGDAPDVGSLNPNEYAAGYAAGKVDAATVS